MDLPTSFGSGIKAFDVEAQIESTRRPKTANDSSDEDSDDEFPVSHELVFRNHEKPVTTITADVSGSRAATGSTDCTMQLIDFASLTPTTLRAFRSVDPTETRESENADSHPIHHLEFNPLAPSLMLVISATPQARVFTRDGERVAETVKGDMYLQDLKNTKGHTAEVSWATWDPTDGNVFASSAADGSVRVWDINRTNKQRDVFVYKSKGRSQMTAVAWNGVLAATAFDGSLVIWQDKRQTVVSAHEPGWANLDISPDGRFIVTKGNDIKLWDTRKLKDPLRAVKHESPQYQSSNIIFSPSGTNILAGDAEGNLHILNAALRPELVTKVSAAPLITVFWHEKLNQVMAGAADGSTHLLYNPEMSQRGAMAIISKPPKRRHIDDGVTADVTPLSGDVTPAAQISQAMAARKAKDTHRPKIPPKTPFGRKNPDEKHVASIPLTSMRDEDPREALFKYAELAKQDPMFTKAYSETQPETIYREAEEPEAKKQKR